MQMHLLRTLCCRYLHPISPARLCVAPTSGASKGAPLGTSVELGCVRALAITCLKGRAFGFLRGEFCTDLDQAKGRQFCSDRGLKSPGRLDQAKGTEPRSLCKDTGIDKPDIEKQPIVSVKIKCRGDIADGLVEALFCFGASSCSIEDANSGGPREQEIYSNGPVAWHAGKRQLWGQSHISAIFPGEQNVGEAITMASHSIGLNEMPHYEVDLVEDQDWIEQLQSMFEPVEVAAGLWIVPKWRAPPDPRAVNIILDPGLAFGTGEHPTTRLCLQWLSQVVRGGERVLDYGTGSGVLAISTLKIGAARAIGVDVDPMAVASATHNASLNMMEDHHFQVFLSDESEKDPVPSGAAYHPVSMNMDEGNDNQGCSDFDIVVANILLNPLLVLSTRIASYAKPGGLIGLSGILVEQVDQVRHRYSSYLDNVQVTQDHGWACVTGIKKLP